ncbi:MAG TPA: hypothetical protein VE965_04040, partial [Gammaproteobacteria bacterium]|nr:hypothetical protein [Gammaproteobacteria bacterium]
VGVLFLALRPDPTGPAAFVQGCISAGGTKKHCTCVLSALEHGPLRVKEYQRNQVVWPPGTSEQAIVDELDRINNQQCP